VAILVLLRSLGCLKNWKYQNIEMIIIWVGFVYLLDAKSEYIDLQFYALGGSIGMVLGAIQSLSRSTYSKLLLRLRIMLPTLVFDVTELQ
jgi:MFS-type transporter involved in bile tolerance (Atg22 family)